MYLAPPTCPAANEPGTPFSTPFITPYAYNLVAWRGGDVSKADVATYDKYLQARRAGLLAYLTINAEFRP